MLRWLTLSPMRLLGFIFFFCSVCLQVSAQKLKWEQTTVNFGTVRDWNSPPATFTFTNSGKERLMFLPQKHTRDVMVQYPNRAIQPGETGEIVIIYYTAETGPFSRTVEIYTNASNKAEQLVVKGNIKTIYANALTACPSFQESAPVRQSEPNVVQVVDASTNRPIPNAQVEILDRGIRKAINGTNLDGVAVNWIEPDNYIVIASKDGYDRLEENVTFTKRNRSHVVYLKRTPSETEEPLVEVAADAEKYRNELASVKPRQSKIVPDKFDEPVAEQPIDLGINTNEQFAEEVEETPLQEFDLGITTNDVLAEEIAEASAEPESLNTSSNDQWNQPVAASIETAEIPEMPLEELDLGINLNDQLDELNTKEPEMTVEQQVEAALAEAESATESELSGSEEEPEFSSERYRPNNVLLLLDVSGSMNDDGKMDKLKSSIRRLVLMLREVDVLTMIAYNSTSWEVLPPTPVADNLAIIALVDSLKPYGYTNGVKGMESAYQSLERQLIVGGNNQLIIATDGKFNSSKFSEKEALQLVKDNSDKGIVLSIIGFGDDKEAGRLMKKLAGSGGGSFLQVNTDEDPTELLAEEIKLRSHK